MNYPNKLFPLISLFALLSCGGGSDSPEPTPTPPTPTVTAPNVVTGYNAAKNNQEFTEIQARYPNKMVVLGECGKGDSGEQGKISDCWNTGAKWGHFMVWYQGGQGSTDTMCSDTWWKNAMTDSHVITREQVKF